MQRQRGVGDTGSSGGRENSKMTMTATTGDYWRNANNHGNGCNC
jgi:hypothetical protein